jgi:hypothetical protein
MATSDIDVGAETDRLYQLSLAEFIAARNALAVRLKSVGDKEDAARVQALARPNVPAWAANQAYWRARREFDGLIASTRRLQSAQAEGAGGTTLRQAMKERREAHAAVMARAESLLVAAGHGASPETRRRLSDTLEALAAESLRPDGVRVRLGRLIRDLAPPGFEVVKQLAHDFSHAPGVIPGPTANTQPDVKRPSGPGLSPAAERANEHRAEALDQARAALAEAERHLESSRREAHEAERARRIVENRAEGARDELDEATRRSERAKERAGRAATEATAAKEEAERKAAALNRAEMVREAALRSLRALE